MPHISFALLALISDKFVAVSVSLTPQRNSTLTQVSSKSGSSPELQGMNPVLMTLTMHLWNKRLYFSANYSQFDHIHQRPADLQTMVVPCPLHYCLSILNNLSSKRQLPLLVPNVVIGTENVVTHALPYLSEEKKEEEKREGKEGKFASFLWTS